jgi:hypothetical protein
MSDSMIDSLVAKAARDEREHVEAFLQSRVAALGITEEEFVRDYELEVGHLLISPPDVVTGDEVVIGRRIYEIKRKDTPSMERIEDMYSWAYAWRTRDGETEDSEPETDLSELRGSQRAEFRRALAAHDAGIVRATAERCAEIARRKIPFDPDEDKSGHAWGAHNTATGIVEKIAAEFRLGVAL